MNGALVAIWVPQDLDLAVTAEAAAEFHLTVGYFGAASELSEQQLADLRGLMLELTSTLFFEPFTITVSGVGRFAATASSDNQDVVVALIDSPQLETLRAALVAGSERLGLPLMRNHGYTPHITLAYISPEEELSCEHTELLTRTVKSLTLKLGDETIRFQFQSAE